MIWLTIWLIWVYIACTLDWNEFGGLVSKPKAYAGHAGQREGEYLLLLTDLNTVYIQILRDFLRNIYVENFSLPIEFINLYLKIDRNPDLLEQLVSIQTPSGFPFFVHK